MFEIWAEFVKFNTSQRLCLQSESNFKERLVFWRRNTRNMWTIVTRIYSREASYKGNQNITEASTTKPPRKKQCTVYKISHEWKECYIIIPKESELNKFKVEIEKVNKLSKNISTNNITGQNKLIRAEVKLVSDNIRIPQGIRTEIGKLDRKWG